MPRKKTIGKKAGVKNSARVLERRERVADLYLRGFSCPQIASECGLSNTTIWEDIRAIQDAWIESSIVNFDRRIAIEIQRLDKVEAEAWVAWDRSKSAEIVKVGSQRVSNGEESQAARQVIRGAKLLGTDPKTGKPIEVIEREGDPRFLKIILDCHDRRTKLLKIPYFEALLAIQTGNRTDGDEGTESEAGRDSVARLTQCIIETAGRIKSGNDAESGAETFPRGESGTAELLSRYGKTPLAD